MAVVSNNAQGEIVTKAKKPAPKPERKDEKQG